MKQIEQLLSSLDGKTARVQSSGLTSESSMEVGVTLLYKQHFGLSLVSSTKYNSTPIHQNLLDRVNRVCQENKFGFDVRESFQNMVREYSDESFVTIGSISPYNIVKTEITYDNTKEAEVREVILHYKEGGRVQVRILK